MSSKLDFKTNETTWKNSSLFEVFQEDFLNFPFENSWKIFFKKEENLKKLQEISEELKKLKCNIYPDITKVFRAFYETPLENIKIVILGQDCYHDGAATGLCFSVGGIQSKMNPSLVNIYKELENEKYFQTEPNLNLKDLTRWAKQGCLMLNTALTVEKGCPESHLELWYEFSEKVIEFVLQNTKNVAWLLMGKKAQAFESIISKHKTHCCFITSHPSPFSAYKPFGKNPEFPAFLGSGIFRDIDNFLQDRKIKWL